jgi:small subunit ribosomal protein S27Ae
MAKKKERGAEGKEKKKRPAKKWTLYEISAEGEGKIKRKNKFCPKCGSGVFLAKHEDRYSCGKCGYTEFLRKEA